LHRVPRQDDTQLLLWAENPHGLHQDLLLAPVREAGEEKSPIYEYLKRLEKQKQDYETGRLLYVATTRAKQQLHLLGSATINSKGELADPSSRSLLSQLWPVVSSRFEKAYQDYQPEFVAEESTDGITSNLLRRLPSDWVLSQCPAPVIWQEELTDLELPDTTPEYEWAGETIRLVGIAVHRFIQFMAEETVTDRDVDTIKSRRPLFEITLKRLGVKNEDLVEAVNNVETALVRLINDDRGKWLFSAEHADQHNEYEISGIYQG